MNSRHFVRKKRLVEWETMMHIVRREVEPLEYRGNLADGHSTHNRIKTKKGEKL